MEPFHGVANRNHEVGPVVDGARLGERRAITTALKRLKQAAELGDGELVVIGVELAVAIRKEEGGVSHSCAKRAFREDPEVLADPSEDTITRLHNVERSVGRGGEVVSGDCVEMGETDVQFRAVTGSCE
jgi:hypothetical protein